VGFSTKVNGFAYETMTGDAVPTSPSNPKIPAKLACLSRIGLLKRLGAKVTRHRGVVQNFNGFLVTRKMSTPMLEGAKTPTHRPEPVRRRGITS
jgi:hypothetical protein